MFATRRSLLKNLAAAYGSLTVFQNCPPIPTPRVRMPSVPSPPADQQNPGASAANSMTIQRRTQEKELRETAEELLLRVTDLKTDLDHTPSASVFSVSIFKRTQEIEKLAKHLKDYAKS
jgi:hypothetical protein